MQTGNAEVDARTYVLRGVDVTTVNWFTISPEVSLFFQHKRKFCLLVCSEVSEVTEMTLNASQTYFGFLFFLSRVPPF